MLFGIRFKKLDIMNIILLDKTANLIYLEFLHMFMSFSIVQELSYI